MSIGRTICWRGVGLGWLVAALIFVAINPLVRGLYDLLAGSPVPLQKLSSGLAVVALVSGFLAYLSGGFVAGRLARSAGGLNGAMTAVVGTLVGAALGAMGVSASGGIWVSAMSFGPAEFALLVAAMVFLSDLFGGYIGGKLGEPSKPGVRHQDQRRNLSSS